MSSQFERTQGTKFEVTDGPATEPNPKNASWLQGQCATREISYTGGQKSDIDVTTLCSTEQEMTNGLAAPAEATLSRNWAGSDPVLAALEQAYDGDELRAFRVTFPSGDGYAFLAEVRQNSWSIATAGVVSASYTLRLKGKPVRLKSGSVPVTAVTLTPTNGTVAAGSSTTFKVNITPADATDKSFSVLSSALPKATATIAGDTVTVNGVSAGSANITVTTTDGGKTAVYAATITA